MNHVYFIHLRATAGWLRLPREQRSSIAAQHLQPLLRPEAAVTARHFDAEAFTVACSDVMMVETKSPRAYYFFMERLRDTPLITEPYFEIVQIVPAIEDGYSAFEKDGRDAAKASVT